MMLFIALLLGVTEPAGVDLLFPSEEKPARLRVSVTVGGDSPEKAWGDFLDRLFTTYDRDRNGLLEPVEAQRVFALPLPDGEQVKLDFAQLDRNQDGQATPEEFRTFYDRAGFRPVVAVVRPPTQAQQQLSAALFRSLDRDGDANLAKAELRQATALLMRLDADENEFLEPAEFFALTPATADKAPQTPVRVASLPGNPEATLHLVLASEVTPRRLVTASPRFAAREDGRRVEVPGGQLQLAERPGVGGNRFRTAKAFYLAQFTAALGGQDSWSQAKLNADPSLQAIAAMFTAADSNGDAELTFAELRAFLDLIEQGINCQVVVTLEDRGANLFDRLDRNLDGRLSYVELRRAADLTPLEADQLPRQYRGRAALGIVGNRFGPVLIPASPARVRRPQPALKGPRWLQAMDRNGDGALSALEFRGSPARFHQFDRNGDGRIDAAEAKVATQKAHPDEPLPR